MSPWLMIAGGVWLAIAYAVLIYAMITGLV